MNRHTNRKRNAAQAALVTAAALCLALAPAAAAQEVAQVRAGATSIDFQPVVEYGGLVLTVSGPDGFHHRAEFGAGEDPSFSIYDQAGGVLPDGSYTWELTVIPTNAQRRDALEANRVGTRSGGTERLIQSGGFSIIGGAVVAGGAEEPDAGPAGGNVLSTKDQVFFDDVIITGSLCVGFDCSSGESFGFDTIRLKENNLRIKFEDTSGGSFPTVDWEIEANSSSSGGPSHFRINDEDSASSPFTIEANTPSHTLYVDSNKRVGIGTSTPVVELHVKDGDSPTLRLEQDGSVGFTPQTWDVAGNETNFFVRDATNGSRLPFRIRPSAPTSSIDIASNGNVGVGTTSPSSSLHVRRTDGTARIFVEEASGSTANRNLLELFNNGAPQVRLENTNSGVQWSFSMLGNDDFAISQQGTGGPELNIEANTRTVEIAGDLNVSGTKNFAVPDPDDPGKRIVFSALEGPEAGTYYRGRAQTIDGEAAIELPGHFAKMTEPDGLTVQLTPIGSWGQLHVVELTPEKLVVRTTEGAEDLGFYYLVQGVRAGYKDFQVERPADSVARR